MAHKMTKKAKGEYSGAPKMTNAEQLAGMSHDVVPGMGKSKPAVSMSGGYKDMKAKMKGKKGY